MEALGELFAAGGRGIPGVRGTIFAKIVHRSGPLHSLYDKYVWRTYVEAPSSNIEQSRSSRGVSSSRCSPPREEDLLQIATSSTRLSGPPARG